MSQDKFEHLTLSKPILRAIAEEGYDEPTPIQQAAIPELMAGNDLMATAQTGTGKTAAFSLPILHGLSKREQKPKGDRYVRALVLTPTRELAVQIDESFRAYGRHLSLRTAVILGGVSQASQVKAMQKRPDIVVATPGRLLDLMSQRIVRLDKVEMLVLDEADRMLDMGFVHDVRKIVRAVPSDRQTMLFSATLSQEVSNLAADMLRNPSKVAVAPPASAPMSIAQKVLFVEQTDKRALLTSVLRGEDVTSALVFTRTKHRADRIMRHLQRDGIKAEAIHSNKSQNARQRALNAFHRGGVKVLVATDIVARGIDVEGISHVINYELPNDPNNYVHRIGRTARAGAEGTALSFCDIGELLNLRGIEKLTKRPLDTVADHPFHSAQIAAMLRKNGVAKTAPKVDDGRPRFGRKNRPAVRRVA